MTHADAVVVVSEELAKHVRALGVKANRIQVMPNGVNPELFHPNGTNHCSSLSSALVKRKEVGRANAAASPTLGFVGGLRPWHGVEVLPDLLARLQKRHPGTRLIIAGDGHLRADLERGFRRHGVAKQVTFTGALLHEEVPAVIRSFDVALAPYRHSHDFLFSPLKLYEYMACGVPVVAARLGQIAESVTHGKTGWLYQPGNVNALVAGCERLLADAALRHQLGSAAAELIENKFTWDHNAARVVALAKRLIR
ncbi:MAG: glycosyltransferase family 4 protein [Verrucomicrobiota bacterium]